MRRVELYRLVHSDQTPECQLYLREVEGGRVFPIVISIHEMAEIHRKVHGLETRRPMTHDLFRQLLSARDLTLERVDITALAEEVFYARMHFSDGKGGEFDLDARPSDAVAIATGTGSPVFAAAEILDAIGIVEPDEPDEPGGPEREDAEPDVEPDAEADDERGQDG